LIAFKLFEQCIFNVVFSLLILKTQLLET